MSGSTLSKGTGKELQKLLALLANATSETLGSLIGRELVLEPIELWLTSAEQLLESLATSHAVVRGALDKGYEGHSFVTLIEVAEACTMSGMMMMTPDEIIEKNRSQGTIEGEDQAAFGELGNVLCAGLGNVLREAVANVDIRLQDHGVLEPGSDPDKLLPELPLVVGRLRLQVGDYPSTTALFVLDRETGEAWNKGPLEQIDATERPAPGPTSTLVEDDLEDLPAAEIHGILNAYVTCADTMTVLRRSCRRVGLDLQRHNRAQIPNPAAHLNEIVLIDVPYDEERRIDWCRRIKDYGAHTLVVLLLHHPCRSLVTKAYLSKADIILGLPIDESQLSSKLASLIKQ